ncbi:MAG: hypothetical protein LLG05_11605, partial [Porphyromonadaceae bacterium]|nr:hypothetical protein [Porphyromonadaceae bacterium]
RTQIAEELSRTELIDRLCEYHERIKQLNEQIESFKSIKMKTRNDFRLQFNKEKQLPVLVTDGTGYIHYSDDYVHWLEELAMQLSTPDQLLPIIEKVFGKEFCEKYKEWSNILAGKPTFEYWLSCHQGKEESK